MKFCKMGLNKKKQPAHIYSSLSSKVGRKTTPSIKVPFSSKVGIIISVYSNSILLKKEQHKSLTE